MRPATSALLALAFATSLPAAAPQPRVDVLDEVTVSARVPLPLEDFLAFPTYDSVVISPDGTLLAMAQTVRPERQLTVVEFPSAKPRDMHFFPSHTGIEDLRWVGEHSVLVQPDVAAPGFFVPKGSPGQLLLRDVGLRRMDVLHDGSDRGPNQAAKGPVRLIAARTGQPDQILFQTTGSEAGGTEGYGAFLMDVQSRQQQRVAISPLPGGQFIVGPDHRVALVAGVSAQNERVVYYLPADARTEGTNWQLVASSGSGERGLRPIAWTGTGEEYFALDGSGATRAVVAWNAQNNTQRLLYRHAVADMDTFALDPAGRPWMFAGSDHFPVYWYPDPAHPLAQLHRQLVQRLPAEQIEVMNATDDLSRAVVRFSSGRRPPVYLVMDVRNASSMESVFTFPKLRGTRLAPVDPIEFRARDGLMIRGYLTTPADVSDKPRRGLPLVVIAHDGPQGKASDSRYEFERQLFASRGYAVLQVNHRGSSGRGVAFERAGDGKWGREVQDDFADGVRWAIRDGVADPGRICFYGTRYGAYSALMAAAREPDLFQCVIGLTGVYDLPRLLDEDRKGIALALQQALGNDKTELKTRSPVNNARAIKARVLLIHEVNDEQIPRNQSSGMRSALRSAGNTPEWELIGQEYGGQFWPQNRAVVYTRMFRFLDQRFGKQ
jgi:dienelactone hydrolase